jgi:hypothetical protein
MKFITITEGIVKHFDRIIWIMLAIVLLLVLKKCDGTNKRLEKAEQAQIKSEAVRKTDSLEYIAKQSRWQDTIKELAGRRELAEIEKDESDRRLQASQQSINRLTAIIRNESGRQDPEAGGMVAVTTQYKDACDSLPDKIDSQNVVIADLKQDNEDLVDLMNYEIVSRDSLIEVEQEQVGKLNSTIAGKNKIIDDALKAGKPRGRLLGGVGLIGNQLNPLGGTKVNIAYQSKGGKQYSIGGIIMQGGVWYEAGVLITLIK